MTACRVLFLLAGIAAAPAAFGQVSITSPSSLPQGYSELPYTYTFTSASITPGPTVVWALANNPANNVPAGYSLSANGTFSGTTNQYGTFSFQVTATSGSFSNTATFTLVLVNPFITISTPPNLGNAFVSQAYSLLLVGASNPAGLTWTVASGSTLPPGLNLSQSGSLSGTPTLAGTYTFTLNAQISGTTITTGQYFTLTVYAGQTTIQTTSLPLGTLAKPYLATLNGGPTGITWTLTGFLPPGIAFDASTGVLSGTTTETITIVGTYPLVFQANYPNYLSATRTLNLYLTNGPLGVAQPSLAPAVQNSPYTAAVVGSGGLPPYQWVFASSNNQGLSINSATGVITGTPLTPGTLLLPVILSDATGQSLTVNLSLFVANPLSVSTTTLPNGFAGTAYSQTLLAGGGVSPFTWLVVGGSGSLPSGLTLSTSGVLSGTPSTTGTFHFTVQVTDAGGRTATRAMTVSVSVPPLSITTSVLPNGQITVPYSQALAASGGVAPYTWALVSGGFPGGLSMNSNGVISGTPLGPLGVTSFTVQVTDSSPAPALTFQKAFSINIALTLTITSIGPLPEGTLAVPYSQALAASGGTPPYTWLVTSGVLPAGLLLNASTGVISGTPTGTGPNLFTVTLTDSAGLTAQQQLNITVVPALSITTGNLSATVGTAFSQTLTATGATPPYTFSTSAGSLPAGLLLSGGVISGTPTAAGTSNLTLKVRDSLGLTATSVISFAVSLPPTPALTFGTIPGTPATQPKVTLSLASAFPVALTGTMTVSFQSAVGGAPTEVQFFTNAGGFTSLVFNIPAGSTTAVFPNTPVLATGTAAGTITLAATLSAAGVNVTPTPAPSETITIPASAPVIQSVTFANTSGSLAVTVTGYSTTRDMVSGVFTFAPVTGSTLSQSAITVQLGSAFSAWYQSSASNQFGGQFLLTVPFSVSGDAADVASVSVTLTNSKGASATVTPQ
jgi:large repetitive protein